MPPNFELNWFLCTKKPKQNKCLIISFIRCFLVMVRLFGFKVVKFFPSKKISCSKLAIKISWEWEQTLPEGLRLTKTINDRLSALGAYLKQILLDGRLLGLGANRNWALIKRMKNKMCQASKKFKKSKAWPRKSFSLI